MNVTIQKKHCTKYCYPKIKPTKIVTFKAEVLLYFIVWLPIVLFHVMISSLWKFNEEHDRNLIMHASFDEKLPKKRLHVDLFDEMSRSSICLLITALPANGGGGRGGRGYLASSWWGYLPSSQYGKYLINVGAAGSNSLVLKSEWYVVCLNFSRNEKRSVEPLFNRIGKKVMMFRSPPTARQVNNMNKGDLTVADPGFLEREGIDP